MKTFFFSFFFFLPLSSASAPFPGLGPDGNPSGMDVSNYKENIVIPAAVISCPNSRFSPSSSGIWTFDQLADAFYEYSVKPWNFPNPLNRSQHVSECVAALVIASGECAPVFGVQGCSTSSGASGVWQTDFLRTIPGFPQQTVMNLCLSAYGIGYMAAPWIAAPGKSCTISVAGGTPASIYTCYQAHITINEYASCPDPQSTSGITYSNFIGPFCHKSWAQRWSPCSGCCPLFNGGGNVGQRPFPQYYFDTSMTQGGNDFLSICQAAADAFPP